MKFNRLALPLVLFVFYALHVHAEDFVGKVAGVTDGDTVSVMHAGRSEKIRLHGIDCPEKGQAFGSKAKQFTSDLCFGKDVTVRVKDADRYGRTVGEIVLPDGKVLNQEIVRAGFGWWYEQYAPQDSILKALQDQARAARQGLWADPAPLPPWEFRHRNESAGTPIPSVQGSETRVIAADTIQVFITTTGKKYHRANCRHLAVSKIPISLKDAKAKGYTPCSVCEPEK